MYHYSIRPETAKTLSEKIALCRSLGVTNLEIGGTINGKPVACLTPAETEEARKALILFGVRIVSIDLSCDVTDKQALRAFLRNAHFLHAEAVRLPKPEDGESTEAWSAKCDTAVRWTASYGMKPLAANDTKSVFKEEKEVASVVRGWKDFGCECVFDTADYGRTGIYPFFGACYSSHAKNSIRFLGVGDLDRDGKPVLPACGVCGFREVTSLLLARSFDGYFSVAEKDIPKGKGWEDMFNALRCELAQM